MSKKEEREEQIALAKKQIIRRIGEHDVENKNYEGGEEMKE